MNSQIEIRKIPDDPIEDCRSQEFKAFVGEGQTIQEHEKVAEDGCEEAGGKGK